MNNVQKPGWIARILLSLAMLALVVVGFFFLTVALIAGALLALVVGVRLWWTLRKLKRDGVGTTGTTGTAGSGAAPLDGEYQVVERESLTEKPPPSPNNTPPAP